MRILVAEDEDLIRDVVVDILYVTGYTHAAPRPVSGSIMLQKPFRLERTHTTKAA